MKPFNGVRANNFLIGDKNNSVISNIQRENEFVLPSNVIHDMITRTKIRNSIS